MQLKGSSPPSFLSWRRRRRRRRRKGRSGSGSGKRRRGRRRSVRYWAKIIFLSNTRTLRK
jgi:hypothetical protein